MTCRAIPICCTSAQQMGGGHRSRIYLLGFTNALNELYSASGGQVPFALGCTDAESFAVLEPTADGFRNYVANGHQRPAEALLVDRAQMLTLTAPEMTGRLACSESNVGKSELGVFTKRPETLTTNFFVNLLDMNIEWTPSSTSEDMFEGRNRLTGEISWTGTRVDLVFGSNSQLRAIAEVYGCDDAQEAFVSDFVAAWNKVMNLDRFDLA